MTEHFFWGPNQQSINHLVSTISVAISAFLLYKMLISMTFLCWNLSVLGLSFNIKGINKFSFSLFGTAVVQLTKRVTSRLDYRA